MIMFSVQNSSLGSQNVFAISILLLFLELLFYSMNTLEHSIKTKIMLGNINDQLNKTECHFFHPTKKIPEKKNIKRKRFFSQPN